MKPDTRALVLFINRSDTQCGVCGHSADPRETSHLTRLGLGDDRRGCGVRWNAVSSDYVGMDDVVKDMRPDLPFVSPENAGHIRRGLPYLTQVLS